MQDRNREEKLSEARAELREWVLATTGHRFSSDAQLTDAVCERMKREFDFDLLTQWNPEGSVFDARWEHRGQPAEQSKQIYSAPINEQSRLLACAGAIRVLRSL